jgi:hypothetical protein
MLRRVAEPAAPRAAGQWDVMDRHVTSCVLASTRRNDQLGPQRMRKHRRYGAMLLGHDPVEQQCGANLELERKLQHRAQIRFAPAILINADRRTIDLGIKRESLL